MFNSGGSGAIESLMSVKAELWHSANGRQVSWTGVWGLAEKDHAAQSRCFCDTDTGFKLCSQGPRSEIHSPLMVKVAGLPLFQKQFPNIAYANKRRSAQKAVHLRSQLLIHQLRSLRYVWRDGGCGGYLGTNWSSKQGSLFQNYNFTNGELVD